MDSSDNPIKNFFTPQNARVLYQAIQQGLRERYQTTIDDRYMEQLLEIMKMVVEPLPKRIPASVDRAKLVQTLNRQVLKEAVPMFANIARGDDSSRSAGNEAIAGRMSDPISNARMTLGAAARPQQSTPIRSVQTDDDVLNQLVSDRAPKQPAIARPQFEADQPEYPDDINELYERAEQYRQHEDVLAPPPVTAAFDPREIRRTPAVYDPNPPRISQLPPRGSERFAEEQTKPAAHDADFARLAGQTLSFADVAPQPSEMRVLIPRESRNQTTDSQNIPHIFVVNSADRFTTAYPSPSNYRIRMRSPYIDVVSVQLISAMIPLSAYNINSSNNTILFEETAGTTLVAVVPPGYYPDAMAFAQAAAISLTAATSLGVTYTGTVDPLTGKITLTSDGAGGAIFSLVFTGTPLVVDDGVDQPQFPPDSSGEALGFSAANYTGSLAYTAPNVPDLDGSPVAYLHIQELQNLESNNSAIHDAFAAIPMKTGSTRGYAAYSAEDIPPVLKYFSPPAGKLSYLTISIRTASGALFDFNGRNHVFSLAIITKDPAQGPYAE